jgi:hypothetical protein
VEPAPHVLLAMQKVEGSNPFSRFADTRSRSGFRPSVCLSGFACASGHAEPLLETTEVGYDIRCKEARLVARRRWNRLRRQHPQRYEVIAPMMV